MRFEHSIEIDATQQRVWDVLTDIEAWPSRIETVSTSQTRCCGASISIECSNRMTRAGYPRRLRQMAQ